MVSINNLTTAVVDEKFLKKVAKMVLRGEGKKMDLSIAFVGQKKIKELNKQYRGKNEATDVLSFSYGEVAICPDKVRKGELARTLIHGILHILGFSHKKMEEDKYLKQICQPIVTSPR